MELEDDWINFEEVHRITGYSRAHIDRLETVTKYMGDDPFPRRSMYGNYRVFWRRSEVVAWKLRRIRPLDPCRPWPARVVRSWYDGLEPAPVRGWTPMGPGWLWRREVIACVVITRGGSPNTAADGLSVGQPHPLSDCRE